VQRNLRGILEKLPKTLDETYERVLKDINEDNFEHARRLLHCLAVAIRPLRVEELAEILAFDFDDVQGSIPKFHAGWRRKDHEEAVLSTCSSLIAIVDYYGSRAVQFSHFSVKEFLTSDRLASSTGDVSRYHILLGPAHTILAQACLGRLLHLDDHVDWENVKNFPLAKYAAEHWVKHAQFEDVASHVKDGIQTLFDPDKPHLVVWVGIHDIDGMNEVLGNLPNPLYYAALCGFHGLVERLVTNHPQLVHGFGGGSDFPLVAALSRQHMRLSEFLLRRGEGVDMQGRDGNTPLHSAVNLADDVVSMDAVRFLLEHGADVNSRKDDLCTPLHQVASYGEIELADMLLDFRADIESRNDEGKTPLHLSCERYPRNTGSPMARFLLERGANVDARDEDYTTPLLLAMDRNNKSYEVAQILLEHGAEPNVKTNGGKTPLHLLSEGGYLSMEDYALDFAWLSRVLLEHGANVNAQDNNHATPLHLAIERVSFAVARILLERGAEPNVENNKGKTPLHLLLERDFHDRDDVNDVLVVERLLLECGADVNAQDEDNTTPLHLASKHPRLEIAEIILDRANDENDRRRAPLRIALEGESNS
jgi:ankyrin repeat protein